MPYIPRIIGTISGLLEIEVLGLKLRTNVLEFLIKCFRLLGFWSKNLRKNMYNWSVDEKKFKREDPEGYKIWKLEQMINYGLGGEKLDKKLLRKYWEKLFLDLETKKFLEFLLWPKKKSLLQNKKKS